MERVALVIGESLVDVVETSDATTTRLPGGSAANVAVALARLGRRTLLASSWADDADGRLLAAHLASSGVGLASDPLQLHHTSTARSTIGPDGGAAYSFDVDWRVSPPQQSSSIVVHVCSLGAVLLPGADDVRRAVAELGQRATVSFDINLRPVVSGVGDDVLARVEWLVRHSDITKASDEDLAALFPHRPVAESAQALLALGPSAVVVTRGPEPAWCVTRTGHIEVPAPKVTVVDTIGAGDTVAAALVDALWARDLLGSEARASLRALQPRAWWEILAHANAAAAVTVSRAGADPPYRSDLLEQE